MSVIPMEAFVLESRDQLQEASEAALELEKAPHRKEPLNQLFRVMHTLKGSSGLFDLEPLTRLVHSAEALLEDARDGSLTLTSAVVDLLLEVLDLLQSWVDALEEEERLPASAPSFSLTLRKRLDAARTREAPIELPLSAPAVPNPQPDWLSTFPPSALEGVSPDGGARWAVRFSPDESCFFNGRDPVEALAALTGVLYLRVDSREPWPSLMELDVYRCNLVFYLIVAAEQAPTRFWPDAPAIHAYQLPEAQPAPSAPAPGTLDGVAKSILQGQLSLLRMHPPSHPAWSGSLKAAARAGSNVLRSSGLSERISEVETALVASLDAGDSLPLLNALEALIGAPLSAALPEAPPPPARPHADAPPKEAPEAHPEAHAEPGEGTKTGRAQSIQVLKVDPARIDRLMELVGELVVAKNSLPFVARRAEREFQQRELAREIKNHYGIINRIAEDLQSAVMQVRMVPVSYAFQRFPRLIRDLARKLNKQVRLEMSGEEVEADKNVIEQMMDPLLHLLRNSVDHGIEVPAAREAAGKPAEGVIRLTAQGLEDRVIIEVIDDGDGIRPGKVQRRAIERGLITQEQATMMSDAETLQLIFAPGFSTAEQVSDISGRGVGMDVVRTMVRRVGGDVSLQSKAGQGTTIRLTLPLSMAITRVMIVEVAQERFGISIDQILEAVRIPRGSLHRVGDREVVVLRDRLVPLLRLRSLLELPAAEAEASVALLVVRVGGTDLGLVVDGLHESVDIILKSPEGILASFPIYSGTAMLGDGRVLLVLNLSELIACP